MGTKLSWAACALVLTSGCAGVEPFEPSLVPDDGAVVGADGDLPTPDADVPDDAAEPLPDGTIDGDAPPVDGPPIDAPPPVPEPTIIVRPLSSEHRAIPGVMHGGWGPHLGHLVRVDGALWLADDGCSGDCNVNVNRRVDYYRLDGDTWSKIWSRPLTGIQQNTGSVGVSGRIHTVGVNTASSQLVTCFYDTTSTNESATRGQCGVIATVPANTNYVGHALTPEGHRMAWATTVGDGGGGQFHWFANYGGGWNGPRTGGIGGYNDASYIVLDFRPEDPSRYTMLGELVSGTAPSWSYRMGIADGDSSTVNATVWTTPIVPASGEVPFTPDDIVVDSLTGDTHIAFRMRLGGSVYYHRPSGGTISEALHSDPSCGRVRMIELEDHRIYRVCGSSMRGELRVRVAPADRSAGPIAWDDLEETVIDLGDDFGAVLGIYPETRNYQDDPVTSFNVAVVGDTHENELVHVSIED